MSLWHFQFCETDSFQMILSGSFEQASFVSMSTLQDMGKLKDFGYIKLSN